MKLNKILIAIVAAVLAVGSFSSCVSDHMDEITDLNLNRCLQPMNLSAKVSQGRNVTFKWDVSKDAEEYLLEVYSDKEMSSMVFSETLPASSVPYVMALDPDKTYYFRVQAKSKGRNDSKWADYDKSVKTFTVMDNLYLKVTDRKPDEVSLAWNAPGEKDIVSRIEYSVLGSDDEPQVVEIEDGKATSITVTGLKPSTQYDFALFSGSANCGELSAWTMPDLSALTPVSDDATLAQAINDGANILLRMEGSPYTIATGELEKGLDVKKGFKLYGEEAADGTKPVVTGTVNIEDTFDGGSLYFEGVEFNGQGTCGFAFQHKEGSTADGIKVASVIYKNCMITGYTKGLFYEWGKTLAIGEYTYESCIINAVNPDGTVGGDGFDVRKATSIDKLNILDNTIYNGFRTFLRVDADPVIKDVRMENNTIMNICFVDNTNNGGIIAFQMVPGSFTLKNNLFLNMVEKTTLTNANTKYKSGEALGIAAEENYFYNCHGGLFTTNFSLSDAAGKVLEADPCFNAKGGQFNIIADSDIYGKKIGASRWWIEYFEEPEDLTLTTIEGSKTWDFNDARYFSSDFNKSKVRNQLLVNVTSSKVTLADGVLGFTAATITNKKGVPQDGFLAFKVSEPGSVIIKAVDENNSSSHITVGVGPVSGTSITVKGGVSATADMTNAQKIVIKDITEESIVYIYSSGKIGVSQLAWSTDTTPVNTALAAPAPSADPTSVTQGEATPVQITWEAVQNADSYSVVFNGKTYAVEEGATSYTIEASVIGFLDPGSYTAQVYANPGKNDIYNTSSEAGTAAFAILPKGDAGGETGLVVKTTEELLNAIAAGKDDIALAEGTFDLGAITLTAPLSLKAQVGAAPKVTGAITVDGEFSSLKLSGLTFDDPSQPVFLTIGPAAAGSDIIVEDCTVKGYTKSAVYAPNAAASVENVIFRNVTVSGIGTGQGGFDFRKGSYGTISITESTLENGFRDFIRCDAAVVTSQITISNNTFSNVSINAGNSILYVRATASGKYSVENNLFLNETGTTTILAKTGTQVPVMSNNFFYGCTSDAFWNGTISKETATAGNGVELTECPVKDAGNGDYTLISGLAMSNRVGASRWNPSCDAGPVSSYEVSSAEELAAALSAGKTEITLKEGTYETGAIAVVPGLRLSGSGDVTVNGSIDINGSDLGKIVIEGITFKGGDNAINVSAASSATSLIVKNCTFDGFTKSVFYDGVGFEATSILFSGVLVKNHGTGQGVFDKRKAAVTAFTIENSTIIGGRDLVRADAGSITGAFSFNNNTVDGSNLGVNGNGIMYVRATGIAYSFKNNLFLNEIAEGKKVLLSKATGVTVPTVASNNYFYNVDPVNFFACLFTEEAAGAVKLSADPVKNAAGGDYTLTDATCISLKVGDPRWL